jgi:hypothetical protein
MLQQQRFAATSSSEDGVVLPGSDVAENVADIDVGNWIRAASLNP